MTMTKKQRAEWRRLDRKILSGKKVSRKEIMRAIELKRMKGGTS